MISESAEKLSAEQAVRILKQQGYACENVQIRKKTIN